MKIKKLNIVFFILFFAKQSFAIGNGFYIGLMAGPATNKADIVFAQQQWPPGTDFNIAQPPILTVAKPRSQQFGVRFFIGNQFSQYAALELGLDFFGQIKYTTGNVQTTGGVNRRIRYIDLVGKGILPMCWFNVYGKVGAAATYITSSGALNPTGIRPAVPATHTPLIDRGSTSYKFKFAPTFSIGASYDINQSWEADISANYLLVGGQVNRVILYAIGLAYHFTDKYCGQFLCDD